MMRKLFKGLVVFLFGICCLYILEGACFRLIDGYANWRLHLAWGKPNQPIDNGALCLGEGESRIGATNI